ncbi:DUF1127 domain-containing protein [Mesorhizobium sp. M7A.F.Ca.US.006.01.1.1]|uniref:DUF1127 domain-containing protein n=1 Tax=Mesorhizobium sp. M7A.F.Ca.US.006.01.1.1 TaxID=2496707 RepID=UPI000FCCA43E|nr:DUF1127 domain-containing protein [Mesorhizobium sp. M7A.F.Ca.US.006.01.1.1]RUZ76698.1 DUF1127 domain-containing protein [Mesorhizobium sp. M7A.F.Ca.US.006.01.1.1]
MTNTLASARRCAARPGTPGRPASRRLLKTLRSIIASWHDRTWRERIRFRWQLRQMSKDNPHLIDDIGLTIQQVEGEIAKSFWER